jgi:hypothetical protein
VSKNAGIDVVRIVWSAEYEPLHVEPSADCPGYVRLLTKTDESTEFYGKVDFTLPKEMALMLAAAIKACAEEQE